MSEKEKNRIAWLSGGYLYRRSMSNNIRKKFISHEIFISDCFTNPDFLLSQMQSIGVFSEKKLVIIKDVPEFQDSNKKKRFLDKLKKIFADLDDNIFVLINGIDKDKEKAFFNVFSSAPNSKHYEFDLKLSSQEAPHWLKARAQTMGYFLDFDAATAIAENGGYDKELNGINADKIEMALHRMILYAAPKKELTVQDAQAIMFEFDKFIIWDLTNAINAKDYDKCIEMSCKFHILDENIRSAVMQMFSTMLWRYRLILFLKDGMTILKNDSEARDKVFQQAASMRKFTSEGSGLSSKMTVDTVKTGDNAGQPSSLWNTQSIQSYLDGMYGREPVINKYSRRDVYRIILSIQESMIILRSSSISDEDAMLVAQLFFATACNKMEDKYIRSIRNSMLERY